MTRRDTRRRTPRTAVRAVLLVLLLALAAAVVAAVAYPGGLAGAWQAAVDAVSRIFGGGRATGAYVEAIGGEPAGLNPLLHRDPQSQQVASLLFCGMTRLDAVGDVLPGLALSWTPTNGNRTWTFTLRSDAVWHDGRPVTARDVTFTLNALASADFPGDLRGEWEGVAARYTGDYTVIVDLPLAEAAFPVRAAVAVLPRHILASIPYIRWFEHDFSRQPVGTGPFVFAAWQEGRKIELKANQQFFLGAPAIGDLTLSFVAAASPVGAVPATVFTGSQAPAANGGLVLAADAAMVERARGITVDRYPSQVFCTLLPNHRGVAGERAVRLAIKAALDLELVAAAAATAVVPAGGPFIPGSTAAAGQPSAGRRDLAGARNVLSGAGWTDGDGDGIRERAGTLLELDLLLPTGRQDLAAAAAEIVRQLAECGIAVRAQAVSLSEYLAGWAPPFAWDLMLLEWVNQPGDDLFELLHSTQQPVRGVAGVLRGGANIAGVNDRETDTVLTSLRNTPLTDMAGRSAAYAALNERLVAEAPFFVLWRELGAYAHADGLEGITPGAVGPYWNIHEWRWR